MGKITCSICGMSSFVKQDGVFICSTCGHKYSVDEIQKLLSSNEQSTSKDNCDDVIHVRSHHPHNLMPLILHQTTSSYQENYPKRYNSCTCQEVRFSEAL